MLGFLRQPNLRGLRGRSHSSIARGSNIGIGDLQATITDPSNSTSLRIQGNDLLGISGGNQSISAALPIPSNRLLPVVIDSRDTDSEVLILEEIATRIANAYKNAGLQPVQKEEIIGQNNRIYANRPYEVFPEVEGTITIFSERKPCPSCSPLIRDIWKQIFPKVEIKVLHGPRYVPQQSRYLTNEKPSDYTTIFQDPLYSTD